MSLAEVAAAAELILEQDKAAEERESSDEGFGGEESEGEGEGEERGQDRSLADSGYGGAGSPPPPLSQESRWVTMTWLVSFQVNELTATDLLNFSTRALVIICCYGDVLVY